jgi:hypothetical protein
MAIIASHEAVELGQRFALGRLDHQRARYREAQRRRVEAVVDQALGHVFGADAGGLGQRAEVEDALVRHTAAPFIAGVQHRVSGRPGAR